MPLTTTFTKKSTIVTACDFPEASQLFSQLKAVYYYDAYQTTATVSIGLLEAYASMVNQAPAWINRLLLIRNKIMALFGIKDVGTLGNIKIPTDMTADLTGMQLDIFQIESINDQEMILALDDMHLNIRLSVLKVLNDDDSATIYISTMITEPNQLGKAYMTLIKPFHKKIVKRLMRNIKLVSHE